MRRACLTLAIVCAAIVPAMAQAPFAPISDVPDYVATMVVRRFATPEDYGRRVSHHGAWTRIDRVEAVSYTHLTLPTNREV